MSRIGWMNQLTFFFALLSIIFLLSFAPAQETTVRAEATPDESMSQAYMALDRSCRSLVNKHDDSVATTNACKKVADEADNFAPKSHFITRRAAYVFYTIALIQAKRPQEAVITGDKAVAVVLLGHDDSSGSSAAYQIRGQAKAFAGDLPGADQDLEKAEAYETIGIKSIEGEFLKAEYSKTLKGLLNFHAQVLTAMGKQGLANVKLEQANKL